jgi:CRP-like cAMP-binding protein
MMRQSTAPRQQYDAAIRRLTALAPLEAPDISALQAAIGQARVVPARRELLQEGREISEPLLIVEGWAARVRILIDGRRQFLSFLLPGEMIGLCRHGQPLAVSTVVALTDMTVARVPDCAPDSALAESLAVSIALEEAYLLAQIARLGRLNAQERIGDLLLELHERLSLSQIATGGSFEVPLTQEVLADAVGLTPVHVNRMIQLLRREGLLAWKGRRVSLRAEETLARMVGRSPVRVVGQKAASPAA